jgi:hypothetical protein
LKPYVERVDELGPDLLAWILGEVGVWFDEDLAGDVRR